MVYDLGSIGHRTLTDWSLTSSDHAAVIVEMKMRQTERCNNVKVVRVDARFMDNIILRDLFLKNLTDRLNQLNEVNLDPHQRLEFLK
jgi:hypothetical protein